MKKLNCSIPISGGRKPQNWRADASAETLKRVEKLQNAPEIPPTQKLDNKQREEIRSYYYEFLMNVSDLTTQEIEHALAHGDQRLYHAFARGNENFSRFHPSEYQHHDITCDNLVNAVRSVARNKNLCKEQKEPNIITVDYKLVSHPSTDFSTSGRRRHQNWRTNEATGKQPK